MTEKVACSFDEKYNNVKKTCEGIKKNLTSAAEKLILLINDKMITDSTEIVNNLNNYFSSIAKKPPRKNLSLQQNV